MEWFLSLFIQHDTLVVSLLVAGITIVVVILLLMTTKSPEAVVKSELGSSDNVESALRRVLGEQRWLQAGATTGGGSSSVDSDKLSELEMEVLEKDRKIAELHKQMTLTGGAGVSHSSDSGDNSELLEKLAQLEARLEEYEIIEDDIADLSLYKTENEKLRKEIEALRARLGGAAPAGPGPDTAEPTANVIPIDTGDEQGADGADLVAEFEKVVNIQSQISTDPDSSRISIKPVTDTGKVVMADQLGNRKKEIEEEPLPVHPKLQHVSPDSKEEAEVFISELKTLTAFRKRTGESE